MNRKATDVKSNKKYTNLRKAIERKEYEKDTKKTCKQFLGKLANKEDGEILSM